MSNKHLNFENLFFSIWIVFDVIFKIKFVVEFSKFKFDIVILLPFHTVMALLLVISWKFISIRFIFPSVSMDIPFVFGFNDWIWNPFIVISEFGWFVFISIRFNVELNCNNVFSLPFNDLWFFVYFYFDFVFYWIF